MSTNEIIRSFVINGIMYGRDDGSNQNHIALQINENVLSIRYSNSLESNRLHQICGLSLVTNIATYGPYTTGNQCGHTKYTVKVPEDTDLGDFIASDAIYDDDLTVLGFKNQEILSVWHGETNIASYTTDSGVWDSGDDYALKNMFDDESSLSIWHSNRDARGTVRTLTITFSSPIDFKHLQIMKRSHSEHPDYNVIYADVCVVLDSDEDNQLCTTEGKGFPDSDEVHVIWTLPKTDVTIVELVFRNTGPYKITAADSAMIRDLKIFYTEIPSKFFSLIFFHRVTI